MDLRYTYSKSRSKWTELLIEHLRRCLEHCQKQAERKRTSCIYSVPLNITGFFHYDMNELMVDLVKTLRARKDVTQANIVNGMSIYVSWNVPKKKTTPDPLQIVELTDSFKRLEEKYASIT